MPFCVPDSSFGTSFRPSKPIFGPKTVGFGPIFSSPVRRTAEMPPSRTVLKLAFAAEIDGNTIVVFGHVWLVELKILA